MVFSSYSLYEVHRLQQNSLKLEVIFLQLLDKNDLLHAFLSPLNYSYQCLSFLRYLS